MTKCKKVLSIVLCLTMLLGTLTIGLLNVSADNEYTNKKYSELKETYGSNFFYFGTEFYDAATGELIEDNVYPGETLTVKCSIKSDYDVYNGVYDLVFDGYMFEYTATAANLTADDSNGKLSIVKTPAKGAKFYTATSTKTTISEAFSAYTTTQMDSWVVLKVTNGNSSTTAAPRSTQSDGVTFSFNIKVKDTPDTTSDSGLGCNFALFDATFTPYSGNATTYATTCYIGGTATTYKQVKADNFATSGNRSFTVSTKASFKDLSGSTVAETEFVSAGDKINLDDIVPTVEGKTFKYWSLDGAKVTGEYTVPEDKATLDFKAVFSDDIISIMTTDSEGQWTQIGEYLGKSGTSLTADDLTAIKAIAEDSKDQIAKDLGIDGVEPAIENIGFNHNGEFSTLNTATIKLYPDDVKFGTVTEVYVISSFNVTVNIWGPNVGEDGVVDADEPEILVSTTTTKFTNDNFEGTYKNSEGKSLDEYQWQFTKGKIGDTAVTDNELANQLYTLSYENGNGKAYKFDTGSTSIFFSKADFTEGKVLTLDFYTKASSNAFYIAIDAGTDNYIIADKAYSFGDTVDSTAFAGEAYRAMVPGTKFSFSGLYDDGTDADYAGYTLKNITATIGDTTLDMDDDGSFVINADSVKALRKGVGNSNLEKGAKFLVLKGVWEAGSYDFTVLYQNSASEWVTLATKTYTGQDTVSTANFLTDDLLQQATDDAPEGAVPDQTKLVKEDGSYFYSAKAYEGPMTLKISYNKGTRYAYIDYNNLEKLEDGEAAKENSNYGVKRVAYGDVLYTPDYDYDKNGASNAPYYNSFLDTLVIPTNPEITYKTDDDGNVMYESKTQVVYNEDGTPKIDPVSKKVVTEVVTQDKVDEDGNVVLDKDGNPVQVEVPDTSKPIVASDPKGNCVYRPYRNSEYMGYKVYHVDGIYTSYSDVMAVQDQWVEGYENSDRTIKQTEILVMQWKSDADFKYRIFTSGKSLFCAKGNDGKMYYWNSNGAPCNKGDSSLNGKTDSFILYFRKRTETCTFSGGQTGSLDYYYAFTIGLANLHPRFLPDLFPLIMKLLKGLL